MEKKKNINFKIFNKMLHKINNLFYKMNVYSCCSVKNIPISQFIRF